MNKKYLVALVCICLFMMSAVIDAMESVKTADELGLTPHKSNQIYLAIIKDNDEWLRELLNESPAILKMKFGPQHENVTPLQLALFNGKIKAAKLLLEKGADRSMPGSSLLVQTAAFNQVPSMQLLVENGFDLNEKISDQTPLLVAIAKNAVEATDFLLEHGAKTDPITIGIATMPLLHLAVYFGAEGAVKLLVEKYKYEVNAKIFVNNRPVSPNDLAVMGAHWRIAQYLKEHGADTKSHYHFMNMIVAEDPHISRK